MVQLDHSIWVINQQCNFFGSFSSDYLSSYRNLEVTLATLDRQLVHQLDQQFFRKFLCICLFNMFYAGDFKQAREIALHQLESRSRLLRIGHWAAYQVAILFKRLNFFGDRKL